MKLLEPVNLGSHLLKNSMAMAPMTRSRANSEGEVGNSTIEYYTQRTSAGLIISEAINISKQAIGSIFTPGIYTQNQIAAWKKVTQSVHEKGGVIYAQLWHTGRVGHSLVKNGEVPVAPSSIAIKGQQHFTSEGPKDYENPLELSKEDIKEIIQAYKQAAVNAMEAGFDGVEVHGANGYLLDEFLRDGANKRTGAYGGPIENRARLLLEVTDAAISVWGADRVGVRISPLNSFNSMSDSDPVGVTTYVATQLAKRGVAYLHLMRADFFGVQQGDVVSPARAAFPGVLMGNMGYAPADAAEAVVSGMLDAVAFGHHYVSNPDLVERVRVGASFAEPDAATFYSQGPAGYTDYPTL